jgi:hypothetical protein
MRKNLAVARLADNSPAFISRIFLAFIDKKPPSLAFSVQKRG